MFLAVLVLGACSAPRRNPVPKDLAATAAVAGMPTVRFWGDTADASLLARYMLSLEREVKAAGVGSIAALPDAHFLALSGGGSDGAFGAGLLCGWTERGDRPTFKIVTGISTGALIAPFAFAGPEYDHVLRDVYTNISTRDIVQQRSILGALTSDAATDVEPLRALVAKYVDQAFIDKVAEESRRGRLLFIGTTNMDAQRPSMWAMGAIAASGHPDSIQLFRDIMIASASIPAVFPPVMIEVQGADGKMYDEMHCDGGVTSQVFLYPASFSFNDLPDQAAVSRKRHVYVIRNAQLSASHKKIDRSIFPIAGRAISTLIKTQGVGDLYRIYLGTQRDGLEYNLAYIPESFTLDSGEAFDPEYMRPLFQLGFDLAKEGYPWAKAPPGFEPPRAGE
jgi:predicted acylesterase/phospholipase RssA